MILIRGIRGEKYARKIEKGNVDCRDVLSTLLDPPKTGYEYSDYYEKNLVKALSFLVNEDKIDLHNPAFLYSILTDYYIPYIYLTYFHVLNEHSIEWLDKFEDDYKFIALDAKIDRNTQTVIGDGFFGSKMEYVHSIHQLNQKDSSRLYAACMCSIENLVKSRTNMLFSLKLYNTLAFALFCREQDEKFTDIENEFRIIAFDCPAVEEHTIKQIPRNITVIGKNGIKYAGQLKANENTVLKSKAYVLSNPYKSLRDIVFEANGNISIDSKFKPINICHISDNYKYIGDKDDCKKFIQEILKSNTQNTYVNKTKKRILKLEDISDAKFTTGFFKVKY